MAKQSRTTEDGWRNRARAISDKTHFQMRPCRYTCAFQHSPINRFATANENCGTGIKNNHVHNCVNNGHKFPHFAWKSLRMYIF